MSIIESIQSVNIFVWSLLASIILYSLDINLSVIIFAIIIAQLIGVLTIGYRVYRRPTIAITAYKTFMNDLEDSIQRLMVQFLHKTSEESTSKIKIITTATGTHFVPIDGLNCVAHTIIGKKDDGSTVEWSMVPDCAYTITPADIGCQSLIVKASGLTLNLNNDESLTLDRIRMEILNID